MLFPTTSTIIFVQMGFILSLLLLLPTASLAALFTRIISLRAGIMVMRIHSYPNYEADCNCN